MSKTVRFEINTSNNNILDEVFIFKNDNYVGYASKNKYLDVSFSNGDKLEWNVNNANSNFSRVCDDPYTECITDLIYIATIIDDTALPNKFIFYFEDVYFICENNICNKKSGTGTSDCIIIGKSCYLSECTSRSNNTITVDKTSINSGDIVNVKVKIQNTISLNCNIYNDISYGSDVKLTPSPFTLDNDGCGTVNLLFNDPGTYNIYARTDYSLTETNRIQITVTGNIIVEPGFSISSEKISENSYKINITKSDSPNGKVHLVKEHPGTIKYYTCIQSDITLDSSGKVTVIVTSSNPITIFATAARLIDLGCCSLYEPLTCSSSNTLYLGCCTDLPLIGCISQQTCTYIKYGLLTFGGLLALSLISNLIPKSK